MRKAQDFSKVVEQVDADWSISSAQKVISAASPWQCESLVRYQNVPWSLVTPQNLCRTPDFGSIPSYGYSACRELPRYGILIFEEYLNSFPHSVCYSLLTLPGKGVKWKGGKARSVPATSSRRFFDLTSSSHCHGIPSLSLSLTSEEKKPIGRTDQLNAY